MASPELSQIVLQTSTVSGYLIILRWWWWWWRRRWWWYKKNL